MGCFAMTETGHGSNVQALGTVATYDAEAGEFVITTTGRRRQQGLHRQRRRRTPSSRWSSPSSRSAGEGHGVHAFVVPIRKDGEPAPGVRIEDDGLKMGLNGVDNGKLWFDGVRVPREALLNRFADVSEDGAYSSADREPQPPLLHDARHPRPGPGLRRRRRHQRQQGRAGHRGPLRAAAPAVRGDVARTRRSCCSTTASTSAGCSRCWPTPTRCTSPRRSWPASATRCSPGDDASDEKVRRELESRAAGTKALGTWHATRTIQECREACGGAGYLAENRFAALKADTDVFTTFEGDNTVLLQLVAKGLLTDYSSEFEDLDQLGMVRFVAGLAVETVVERTSVHKLLERVRDLLPGGDEWDQEAGLLDPTYQLAMLRFREEHILGGVARRLKRGIDAGDEPRRGLLPGPGPRHPRRPGARRAAGARGVRREGRGRWRTATTRSRSRCSATCTRCR